MGFSQPILALLLAAVALASGVIINHCSDGTPCPKSISAMTISSEGYLIVASEESLIAAPNPSPYPPSFLYATRDLVSWDVIPDHGDGMFITSLAAHPFGPIVATGHPKLATQAGIHYSKSVATDGFRGILVSSGGSYYNARAVGETEDMIAMLSTPHPDISAPVTHTSAPVAVSAPFLRLLNKTATAGATAVSTYPYISLSTGRDGMFFGHVRLANDSSLGYPLDITFPGKETWYLTRAPYSAPGLKPTANGGIWRTDSSGQKWKQVRLALSEVATAIDCFDKNNCVVALQKAGYVVIEGTRDGGNRWLPLFTSFPNGVPVFVRMTSSNAAVVAVQPANPSDDAYLVGCGDIFGHGVWREESMGKVSKITALVPKPSAVAVFASVVDVDGATSRIYDYSYSDV